MSRSAILCVDDEAIILTSLREQLRRRFGDRYVVETASHAHEAWDVIEELCVDGVDVLVIVSDWLMPGIRGDQFLIDIHARHPRIVTVMLTGQADEAAIERARRHANLHACLQKPWREDDLVHAIASALG